MVFLGLEDYLHKHRLFLIVLKIVKNSKIFSLHLNMTKKNNKSSRFNQNTFGILENWLKWTD